MESGALKILDPHLYRRRQLIAGFNRWLSTVVGLLCLLYLWDSPKMLQGPAVALAIVYSAYNLASQAWVRRHPRSRAVKDVHNVVDALAVGYGAIVSGGLESPFWLLLYPHVVAVSVRGGLAYAMALGFLDAGIVMALARLTPGQPLGNLHAIALVWCAFMGGTMSSYLRAVRARLYDANQELAAKNVQLSETLSAREAGERQQQEALARLLESEERYRRLIARIQDGVLIIQDGRVAYANRVFAEMVGDTPEGLVGTDFRELIPPEDRADVSDRYRRWEQSEATSGGFESRVRTRKGETLLASLRAGSVELEGRRSVIATIRDITRERRMEEDVKAHAERLAEANRRLEELDQLRRQYLRNVSHEFRTPLTVIKGYAEYLADGGSPDERVREVMRVIVESCNRVIDMVDTLLEVSRIEQGAAQETLQVQSLDLRELASSILEQLRPAAEKKGIALSLECRGEPLQLQGDAGLLHHLVRHLVDNAVKYSPSGARVVVRGFPAGEALVLEVQDSGIGIPAEHLPRIFEKFYMVDGSIARRVGGTGVGLYLVREIVRLHSGSVDVQSRLGEGSIFSVRLPRVFQAQATVA